MSAWFDTPNPTPKRRRPMAELLVELAERNGDPVWGARSAVAPTAWSGTGTLVHGTTNGYHTYGCRCEACTEANSEAGRLWRNRKRDAS